MQPSTDPEWEEEEERDHSTFLQPVDPWDCHTVPRRTHSPHPPAVPPHKDCFPVCVVKLSSPHPPLHPLLPLHYHPHLVQAAPLPPPEFNPLLSLSFLLLLLKRGINWRGGWPFSPCLSCVFLPSRPTPTPFSLSFHHLYTVSPAVIPPFNPPPPHHQLCCQVWSWGGGVTLCQSASSLQSSTPLITLLLIRLLRCQILLLFLIFSGTLFHFFFCCCLFNCHAPSHLHHFNTIIFFKHPRPNSRGA